MELVEKFLWLWEKKEPLFFLIARRIDELEKTKKLVEDANGKAEIFSVDLSKIEGINGLITKIGSITKQVNILANIAGIWHGKNEAYSGVDFGKFSQEVIVDTYTVGLTAPTLLVHGLIPIMPGGGKIINLSGTFESGAKGWLPYYVSKRAIEDLTIGLSEELKDKNIQVNCVSPSDVATEEYKKYFPEYIKDAMDPKDVVNFAVDILFSNQTGKVFILKKGKEPEEKFH